MINNSEIVNTIFERCLLIGTKIEESDQIIIDCIVQKFVLSKSEIQNNKDEIVRILNCMHDNFKLGSGGGWSFLRLPFDKYDRHWCEHPTAEKLCALGIALGIVKFQFPRDLWESLPGGVPYLVIDL